MNGLEEKTPSWKLIYRLIRQFYYSWRFRCSKTPGWYCKLRFGAYLFVFLIDTLCSRCVKRDESPNWKTIAAFNILISNPLEIYSTATWRNCWSGTYAAFESGKIRQRSQFEAFFTEQKDLFAFFSTHVSVVRWSSLISDVAHAVPINSITISRRWIGSLTQSNAISSKWIVCISCTCSSICSSAAKIDWKPAIFSKTKAKNESLSRW